MKVSRLISTLAVLLFTVSCEREVTDVDLPNDDPKLVVYSYISPSDTLISILVSKTVPFFGPSARNNDLKPVSDAVVLISSSTGNVVQIPYETNQLYYSIPNDANFPIIAGQTYQIEVSTPDGLRCTANTTVPVEAPTQFSVKKDSTINRNFGFSSIEYQIISEWRDIVGTSNYYSIHVLKKERYIIRNNMVDTVDFYSGICNEVKTDEGANGGLFNSRCIFSQSVLDSANFFSGKVSFLTTDISYYKYHESLLRYNDDIPFSEPVQVFSNVEGGLGCFGSYLQHDVIF